jgi:RND family efflux transporter MFP subunit
MRLAIVCVVAACGSKAAPPPPPPPTVDVTTLQDSEVADATEYLAFLRSRTAATIQPQVGGQVTAILVQPGDVVEQNQPLVQIDPGRQTAAVAAAEAQRTSRRAALELAEQDLARVQKLVDKGAVPRQDLDNVRAAVDTTRADVIGLDAQITSNRVQLGYYKVVAPARGVIGDIPARIGDTVTPQTTLTTVTDNSVLEARVSVPVERANQITLATRIDIIDAAGHTIGSGTMKFASAQVTAETQSVLVKADVDNAKGALRSDQSVRARVVWTTHKGLRVPALAVTRLGGQSFVFVATQDAARLVAKQRPVKLGELVDNAYIVVEGLKPGERIITSNIQKLRDGAPIQIKA